MKIAGLPDLLSVYGRSVQKKRSDQNDSKMSKKVGGWGVECSPASSRMAFSLATSLMAMQVWRSRPPCSGLPVEGSGFGSSMRWIISEPTHNHAPRYGSLSSGRASFISRPERGNSEQNATIESISDVYVCKGLAYRAGCDNNRATSRDSHRVFQHGEHKELQYLYHELPLIKNISNANVI